MVLVAEAPEGDSRERGDESSTSILTTKNHDVSCIWRMKKIQLKDRRVIVVGGSSGIGLKLCEELVTVGADVVIASRSAEKLDATKRKLKDKVTTYELDASDEQAVLHFFAHVGNFDHLIVTIKPDHMISEFVTTSICEIRKAFEAKFWGQYYLARHCLPSISKDGSILLTSGIASSRGYKGYSGIAAINGAIESLVKTLAVELAPLRVNAVCPGFIERYRNDFERYDIIKTLGARPPLDRMGSHEEVSAAYAFLLQNQYATGIVLPIDGGELCA